VHTNRPVRSLDPLDWHPRPSLLDNRETQTGQWIQRQTPKRQTSSSNGQKSTANTQGRLNGTSTISDTLRTNCSHLSVFDERLVSEEQEVVAKLLARHYRVESSSNNKRASKGPIKVKGSEDGRSGDEMLLELPRPVNVTVLIISWYPPILKLSWNLNELSEADTNKLNFFENLANSGESPAETLDNETQGQASEQFDLELAIGSSENEFNDRLGGQNLTTSAEEKVMEELRARRCLVRKSLTCFQVIYNIINSR